MSAAFCSVIAKGKFARFVGVKSRISFALIALDQEFASSLRPFFATAPTFPCPAPPPYHLMPISSFFTFRFSLLCRFVTTVRSLHHGIEKFRFFFSIHYLFCYRKSAPFHVPLFFPFFLTCVLISLTRLSLGTHSRYTICFRCILFLRGILWRILY